MNLHKQDDHIFNKALQKTSAELLKIVQEELDADPRFQLTDGALERIRPLKETLGPVSTTLDRVKCAPTQPLQSA